MNKLERKMIQTYWKTAGGILLDSFFIAETDNGDRIVADALIVAAADYFQTSKERNIRGQDVIVLFAIEGYPNVAYFGKVLLGVSLIQSLFEPRSSRLVVLCSSDDQVIRRSLENLSHVQMIVYDDNNLIDDVSKIPLMLAGEPFRFICNLEPKRDYATGRVREFYPQNDYEGISPLHRYGQGPFCVFTIPVSTTGIEGVYAILVDDDVKYIGSCEDLYEKFHFQFGHIQPRDCYSGGHPESCRINHLVMDAALEGKSVKLVFSQRSRKDALLSELIRMIKPKWNIHGKRAPRQRFPLDVANISEFITRDWGLKGLVPGKRYKALSDYLNNVEVDDITLNYDFMETLIGRKLPPSAYKYSTWWSNGNRTQAVSWLAAGWRVKVVDIGKSVIFRRVNK